MRRFFCVLLCFTLLLPGLALADKTITITFTGDVTLGSEEKKRENAASFDSFAAERGYDYFFANMKDFFAEDDLTVVNLEGVLSDSKAGEKKDKTYRFRGPTDFVNILTRSGIEACNIANNHSMDYGQKGYDATQATLETAGLGVFGNDSVYIYEKDDIRIAFLGVNSTAYNKRKTWAKEEIARLKAEENVNAVVYVFHGGTEYGRVRNQIQEKASRYFIDCGADLIVMHHPHVVQGFDVYKNRSICYSLGNFCFGGNKQVRALPCMMVRATLTFADDGAYLGQQLALYPAHISGTDPQNNYQPLLVSGEDAQAAMALAQRDTNYTLNPFDDAAGCALQDYLPAD